MDARPLSETGKSGECTSRRTFLRSSLTAACAFCTGACNRHAPAPAGIRSQKEFVPAYVGAETTGKMKEVEAALWSMLGNCRCCPRRCGVNRLKGETGFCSSTARLKVHSAAAHFGEEKPLVGRGGSGTIFFSHCNLLCCFCQNWQINHRGDGTYISHERLAELMVGLQERGCHNINLVTPSHVVPHIIKALRLAIPMGLRVPLVFNTGGYDSPEVIRMLDGIVDIYLPDFKYQDGALAGKYSSGAFDYPEVAAQVIREMHRQTGVLQVDSMGIAQRGLIIRHLVMPENIAGTDRFVQWVAAELTRDTYVNLMAQYRPEYEASSHPSLARRITQEEWRNALRWAAEAGLTNLDR